MKMPKFELTKIYEDGSQETPEVFPVEKLPFDAHTGRRGFLGAGMAAAALLTNGTLLSGKASVAKTALPSASGILAHDSALESLHFSEDGKTLISKAINDLKIWTMPSGKLRRTISEGWGDLRIASLPGSKFFAFLDKDQRPQIRHLTNGDLYRTLHLEASKYHTQGFSFEDQNFPSGLLAGTPDGKILLASLPHENRIEFFRVETGEKIRELKSCFAQAKQFNWTLSPDGKHLYVAEVPADSSSLQINIRQTSDGALVKTLAKFPKPLGCYRLMVLKNGQRLFAVVDNDKAYGNNNDDNWLCAWNLKNGEVDFYFKGASNLACVAPDGSVAYNKAAGNIWVWQTPSLSDQQRQVLNLLGMDSYESLKKPEKKLWGPGSEITAIAVSPDGNLLATGHDSGAIVIWNAQTGETVSHLFDRKINENDGVSYEVYDQTLGQRTTFTLPCGSPIPPGAVCTCNCVSGTKPVYRAPSYDDDDDRGGSSGGGTYCSCDKICTCVPICQAHRLLHPDPAVRLMAEEILLILGKKERAYLDWACAEAAAPRLKKRIRQFIRRTEAGEPPNPTRWLPAPVLENYIASEDEVVRVMAAQMLGQQWQGGLAQLPVSLFEKMKNVLVESERLHWRHRRNGFERFSNETQKLFKSEVLKK